MRPGRYSGYPRKSDGRPLAGCCCGGDRCYTWTRYFPCGQPPFTPPYPKGSGVPRISPVHSCVRALVWPEVYWTADGFSGDAGCIDTSCLIGADGGNINPRWTFRIAEACSHSRFMSNEPGWTSTNPAVVEGLPIVSRCWNLNPVTGEGVLQHKDCINMDGIYDEWWMPTLNGDGVEVGTRFAMAWICSVQVWRKRNTNGTYTYLGPKGVNVTMIAYVPSDKEIEEWNSAQFIAPVCS